MKRSVLCRAAVLIAVSAQGVSADRLVSNEAATLKATKSKLARQKWPLDQWHLS